MDQILTMFEQTVERFADKPAVTYKDITYTFRELCECAKNLAKVIRSYEKKNRKPIAVLVERGADTTVFFLAVLYSGNFYVPIDPDLPITKKQAVLEDSTPTILLCGEKQRDLVGAMGFGGTVLTMADADREAEDDLDEIHIQPEDPIYMVYTSGSTGKPKGVLKSHGAVCSFIRAFAETFALTDEEIIGNQTPFFFDASAKDIYLMLYTGATMDIIPSEMFVFPPKLIEYVNQRKITYVCWVPTALAMVTQVNTFSVIVPETIRKVFFVGEVFPIKQLKKWMERLPELEYVNLYGSTELSGISCYARLNPAEELEYVPMGVALSNCKVFLYDREHNCRITEPGINGEVCVVSEALALEYYNDPEKTASVFCQMPASLVEEKPEDPKMLLRVLQTGDLARYDERGNLVFASRKDFQIKHMGRRIELGEIESIADQLTEIQRCCCLYDNVKNRIVIFCELQEGCDWNGRQVRSALKGHLTDYMMPSKAVIMEKLPLNANGKIDRNSLKSLI